MKSSFYNISLNDVRICLRDLAYILQLIAVITLLPLVVTAVYYYNDAPEILSMKALSFLIPSIILYVLYWVFNAASLNAQSKTKHVMISFAIAWLILALVGSIPFLLRGVISSPLDAFFESMSGWTTSRFTMILDVTNTDNDILFYRSLMQGIGGLGAVSLGLMILLQGGSIGVGYSDVGVQRIKPGIRQTINESWKIYLLYILFGTVMLYIAGMNVFDALNHAMTAMATGGFSTHNNVGFTGLLSVEIVLIVLMFLGMTSFILHSRLFSGDIKALYSAEFKYMIVLVVIGTILVAASIYGKSLPGVDTTSVFDLFRKSAFFVVSGMSTTGFNTVDYGPWPDFAKALITGLMYVGGMSSSTAGGIRVIRFIILLKAIHYSLKKLVLPKTAVVMIKVDGKAIQEDLMSVVGYSAAYLLISMMLALVLMFLGYDSIDSVLTIMSAMSNNGLGVISGTAWFQMHPLGKMVIILGMWLGRIEIYAGLLILRSALDRLKVL